MQEQWGKFVAISKILTVSERCEKYPSVDEGAPTPTPTTQVKASHGWFSRSRLLGFVCPGSYLTPTVKGQPILGDIRR